MEGNGDLTSLELFAQCDAGTLDRLRGALTLEHHDAGETVIRQGDAGTFFLIVLEGSVAIWRDGRAVRHGLGVAGPGSILGELAMLTGHPRAATVTATTPVRVAVGGQDAFDLLLETPGLHDRLMEIAARRLAESASPIRASLRDGTALALRPLQPNDRDSLTEEIGRQPLEMLRRRFFTPGTPSPRTIEYLVNINYVDHFAWVAMTRDTGRGVGVGRYVRLRDDPACAELAFGVADDYQGRGIATLLLGVLAVTASTAGIERFEATVLSDNRSMRAVLDRLRVRWSDSEPGVISTTFPVATAVSLLDAALRPEVARIARDVATGAGLALTR